MEGSFAEVTRASERSDIANYCECKIEFGGHGSALRPHGNDGVGIEIAHSRDDRFASGDIRIDRQINFADAGTDEIGEDCLLVGRAGDEEEARGEQTFLGDTAEFIDD